MNVQGRLRFSTLAAILVLLFAFQVMAADTAPARDAVPTSPRLLSARAAVAGPATTLTLDFKGEFSYRPAPSGERLLLVDLPGVVSVHSSDSRLVTSNIVSSYRMVP